MEQSSWETPEHGIGPWHPYLALIEHLLRASKSGSDLEAEHWKLLDLGKVWELLSVWIHNSWEDEVEKEWQGLLVFFSVPSFAFSLFAVAWTYICADPNPFGMLGLLTLRKRCEKTTSECWPASDAFTTATNLAAVGFLWPHLPVLDTVKS